MKYEDKYLYAMAALALSEAVDEPTFVRQLPHGKLFVEKIERGVTLGERNCPPVCGDHRCDVLDEHHCNACLTPTGFIVSTEGDAFTVCSEECLNDLAVRFQLPSKKKKASPKTRPSRSAGRDVNFSLPFATA